MLNLTLPLALAIALPNGFQEPSAPTDEPRVEVTLVTDRVQIAANEDFELAARFVVPEGWHIGWENPGDFGAPTQVRVTGPAGFEISDPLRPAPRSFVLDDGRVTFGHTGETVFFFRVRAPSDLPETRRIAFTVTAEWLALGPGQAARAGKERVEALLPTYPLRDKKPSTSSEALARHRARIPRAWKQLEQATLEWTVAYADSGEGLGLTLAVDVAHADLLEWFPRPIAGLEWAGSSFEQREEHALLSNAYQWFSKVHDAPPDARGVLRVVRDGVETFFEARVTRPTPLANR